MDGDGDLMAVPPLDDSAENMNSKGSLMGSTGKIEDDLADSRPWRSDTGVKAISISSNNGRDQLSLGDDGSTSNSITPDTNGGDDFDPLAALIERETAEWNSQASLKY
jgi:hypothetical protein